MVIVYAILFCACVYAREEALCYERLLFLRDDEVRIGEVCEDED